MFRELQKSLRRLIQARLRTEQTQRQAHAASEVSTSLIQYEVPNTMASSLKL
jgi:hypothetical protein